MKVLIGPTSFGESDSAPLEKLKKAGFVIIPNPFKRKLTKDETIKLLQNGVTGLIAGLETLDKEVLNSSKLKVISRCGSGMSNIDLDAAKALGIKVFYTPFGPVDSVAELTLTCLLSLLRQVPLADKALHERRWEKRTGHLLKDKTVAIIGFGRIGQRLAELLLPFQNKILAVDPFFNSKVAGVTNVELKVALPLADVITLHSSGSSCILGENEFEMMKKGVYILNAARGELIDENSLLKYLSNEKVAGAWLDTFSKEPYDGLLCSYPNVILTPHIGSYTTEGRQKMEMDCVDNLLNG